MAKILCVLYNDPVTGTGPHWSPAQHLIVDRGALADSGAHSYSTAAETKRTD